MIIWCCVCGRDVEAHGIPAKRFYNCRRRGVENKTVWQCPGCLNYVGSHRGGRPLGCIPDPELRRARGLIHELLDPLWRDGPYSRNKLYAAISERLGIREYHTAELRTIEDARKAYRVILDIKKEADPRA